MKKILLAFFLVFAMFGSALADDVADINAATEVLRNAMLKADKAALEKSVMPDLIYVHSAGKVENAAQFVGAIVGDNKIETYHEVNFNNQKVATNGQLAVVTHIFDGKVSSKGRNDNPYTVHIGVTQIWRKDGGAWKLQARKATGLSF
ncbi:MAG: hypothetical protein DELT_01299 [Desulfovibrio sp.]